VRYQTGLEDIDVMCDALVRPFYQRLGFIAAPGAVIRRKDCATLRS